MFLSTECSKIQTLVTTIVTMQEKKQNFYLFVVMKFCPPTPWKPKFLPNDDRICKYLNTYLFIRHGTIVLSLQDQHLELNNSVLGRQSIGIYGPYSQHSFEPWARDARKPVFWESHKHEPRSLKFRIIEEKG